MLHAKFSSKTMCMYLIMFMCYMHYRVHYRKRRIGVLQRRSQPMTLVIPLCKLTYRTISIHNHFYFTSVLQLHSLFVNPSALITFLYPFFFTLLLLYYCTVHFLTLCVCVCVCTCVFVLASDFRTSFPHY